MKPLESIYWIRLVLGVVAALLSIGYGIATNTISSVPTFDTLLNGASLAIILYIGSYYYVKFRYQSKVQKTSKIFTAGIGIYFLGWIVVWVLLYTLRAGPS